MKSKRRHDLETNELARRLSDWGDRVRPYSTAITVATVAVAATLVVWMIASRYFASREQKAWDSYMYAMTSSTSNWDALHEVAEENPDTPMGTLASVTWADAELRQATENYFRDEAEAQKHLDNAIKTYRQLIEEADDPAIKNRARLGMGRALETDGKVKEAIEFYASVEGPFAQFAEERSKQLGDASLQDAIQWLATAEVPEIQAPLGPGTPGLRPPFPSDFSLDPQIPPTSSGASNPLSPGSTPSGAGNQNAAPPPLDLPNPFTTPSDPDRYTRPPSEQGPQDPPPATSELPAGEPPAAQPDPKEGE